MSPHQQRGRERRETILRAALEIIAESGTRGVTHRAVAARARVPLAGTTYYFASIQDLVAEAMRLGVEDRLAQWAAIIPEDEPLHIEPGTRIEETVLYTVLRRPRNDVIAQIEMYLEAARTPELQPGAKEAIDSFEALCSRFLRYVGDGPDRGLAIAMSALIDGLALHRVVRPLPVEQEAAALTLAMRAIVIAHICDDEQIEAWRDQIQARISAAHENR